MKGAKKNKEARCYKCSRIDSSVYNRIAPLWRTNCTADVILAPTRFLKKPHLIEGRRVYHTFGFWLAETHHILEWKPSIKLARACNLKFESRPVVISTVIYGLFVWLLLFSLFYIALGIHRSLHSRWLDFQQAANVEYSVQVPIAQLTTVADAFDAQTGVAICASLPTFITFGYSVGASLRSDITRLWSCVTAQVHYSSSSSESVLAANEQLPHRLVHALDKKGRLNSMPFSVSAPGALCFDHGLRLGDLPGE
jgi:hypothetical protein